MGCLLGAAPAMAQGVETAAQTLFDAGIALMEKGLYPEAIAKLEESYKLQPDTGTRYRLAVCYERVGRFASAWAAWREVADRLEQAGEKARAQEARARAAALQSKLAHLRLVVAKAVRDAEGLVVKRDGVEVGKGTFGAAVPVDPGPHQITVTAPGWKVWETTIDVPGDGAGERTPVEVEVLELEKAPPVADPVAAPSSARWPLFLTAASLGVVGLGVGAAFGGAAIQRWDDALDNCLGRQVNKCYPRGIELGKEADMLATVSNIGFIVAGGGLLGAGIAWFALPSEPPPAPRSSSAPGSKRAPAARWISPVAGPGFGGLAVGGAF